MNYIVKTLIYATITLGLVACSQEDINSTEQQKAKEEITFTVDVTLDKNVEDMVNAKQMTNVWDAEQPAATRTPITYDKQGSLTYNWRVGSTIPLFVYITDGTRQISRKVAKGLQIISANKGYFTFSVPSDFDLSKLQVASATGKEDGVENGAWTQGIGANGVMRVFGPEVIDASSYDYNIPLYSKLTKVDPATKHAKVQFLMLGSWIGVRAKSDMYYKSNVYSIALKSDVLHMDGTFDLSQASPVWKPSSYRINIDKRQGKVLDECDTIRVNNFAIGGEADGAGTTKYTKPFYIWVKATPGVTSTTKTRVILRSEADSKTGAVAPQIDFLSMRNRFYREAKATVAFKDGDTYNFSINASLKETRGALMITEYYHSSAENGENSWIEITNASRETVSLKGYYLVSPNPWNVPPYGRLYVANLTDLKTLSRGSSSVGMPGNSTTSIPAGKSICLAAGTGYAEVVAKNKAYQVINTGSGIASPSAVTGGVHYSKFICKDGWNIDLRDPNNNIVDNFGIQVHYILNGSNGFYYNYYLGEKDFIRSKETPFNAPYNGFNPKGWYYMPIETSGLNFLGTFNDYDGRFIPFKDYNDGGDFTKRDRYRDMSYYTDIVHLP
ncbi:lamin tail domain-containing protein [Prevotella melaninogenica]|uniref:lamin tail domain-containing protein n=1 Tax=Prevotella melaninogenica TaxID=28132 RepID=UPI001C5E3E17|nr:lamin tail domain-containing protein [Prevotella melaninogenica]MBW4740939.1 lamin tail domain-containing protein [Prevotella melaninogenica]MBW4911712.1 lamin tail domain-containing protein [Prevotella melaninogenica]